MELSQMEDSAKDVRLFRHTEHTSARYVSLPLSDPGTLPVFVILRVLFLFAVATPVF